MRPAGATGTASRGCAPAPFGRGDATFRKRAGLRNSAAAASASDGEFGLGRAPAALGGKFDCFFLQPSVLAQVCASERAALDRLRKEPSAEAARLFWRDLKCARLRPQVRLLMDSSSTPRHDHPGSAAEPGEADSRRAVTIDAQTANGTDSAACRRETPELHRIRATLDLGDANRFASAVTCDALQAPGSWRDYWRA